MTSPADYQRQFYDDMMDGAVRSANAVVPIVMNLLGNPSSVVDFGCGPGAWLREFKRCGASRISGYDFGEGARESLLIDASDYSSVDLSAPVKAQPHNLCVSLEVAEHLDESAADTFIDSLVNSASRILFSAAVPKQGGHQHINEQPPSYWISKFEKRNFRCFDVLRPIVWDDNRIDWWYRQNMLLFLDAGLIYEAERLSELPSFRGAHIIHPESYAGIHSWLQQALNRVRPGQ